MTANLRIVDPPLVSGRSLIEERLFEVLVGRIVTDHGLERDTAERVMDQALAFLAASGQGIGNTLSPSSLVDIGWHVFLLYTREYTDFCSRTTGRYIHHVPDDSPFAGPAEVQALTPAEARDRTITAIRKAGYAVDEPLWTLGALDCYEEGNCRASGPNGDENQGTRRQPPFRAQ
jgi:hypothetical protein